MYPLLALVLVLALTGYVRWRLLSMPLERDEGEFAYIAQQWLEGVPPYRSGYAMKMPGIYAAYALILLVFGETISGIHAGAAVANLISIVLVFLVARKLYGAWLAVVAAGMFSLLTLDPVVESVGQAEHFVILPALVGILLLQVAYERAARQKVPLLLWLLAAGFCLGMSPVVKQHGFVFVPFGAWIVFYRWWREAEQRPWALVARLSALLAGGAVPFALVCGAMYGWGVFDQFWFWTIRYSRMYASYTPWSEGARRLVEQCGAFARSLPLIWCLVLVGFSALLWDAQARARRWFVLPWAACSFLAVCPGMYFRGHYFVYVLPVAAILSALGCGAVGGLVERVRRRPSATDQAWNGLLVGAIVFALSVGWQSEYLFRASPREAVRIMYQFNAFPEAVEIARYISSHSLEEGPIIVLGSEPQIYLYTNRKSASPHIYMYPLMEVHPYALRMQHELADEIERARPEWIVTEMNNAGWQWEPKSEGWIFDWIEKTLQRDYEVEGVIDVMSLTDTNYVWGAAARDYERRSNLTLGVYRRKDLSRASAAGGLSTPSHN